MTHKIQSITKGTVQRQRHGESVFQTVSAGTVLLDGDRLKTSPDAVVTLKCGDKPGLQPGVSYTLVVKANTTRESTEDISPRFTTLSKEEAEDVRTIAKQIEAENLPAIEKKIKLAEHYADHNLIAEAIEILEGLPKAEKSIAVYLRIGVLYSSIGLTRKAEVAYNEAIELPNVAENTQELAAVKVGLGEVKFELNNKEEAIRLLEEAKADYEKLGDAQRVKELQERIDEI